jgi:hypothetical protein
LLRRVLASLLAVALLGGAVAGAGCGDDDIGVEAIAQAAEKTAGFPGSRVTMTGSMQAEVLPGPLEMSGSGVFNGETGRSRFQMQVSAPRVGLISIETVSGDPTGLVQYIRSPLFGTVLPGGKEWMKLDVERAQEELGLGGLQPATRQADPRAQLDSLRAVSGEVEEVGGEEVRGVETTHYRAEVDFRRYADLVAESDRPAAEESIDRLIELTGSDTMPVEVWVDGKELVRRFRIEMPFDILGLDSTVEMTTEIFDFGIRPNIELPPDDEVYDVTDADLRGIGALPGQ